MLSVIHHHRRAAIWVSAASGVVLLGIVATPVAEAPAMPQPGIISVERSPSGKVIDRLPGAPLAAPRFAPSVARSVWPMAAMAASGIPLAFVTKRDLGGIDDTLADKPVRVAAAKGAAPTLKPARSTASPKVPVAIAAAPPSRPAALSPPRDIPQVAVSPERHPSVSSRMVAFVGSLAQLVHPL